MSLTRLSCAIFHCTPQGRFILHAPVWHEPTGVAEKADPAHTDAMTTDDVTTDDVFIWPFHRADRPDHGRFARNDSLQQIQIDRDMRIIVKN